MGHDCDELLGQLGDYFSGELDEAEQARLRQHLEGCPPCFESADFQSQLRELLPRRCHEDVPASLADRVKALLDEA